MASIVWVKFAEDKRYEFELHDRDFSGETPESARRWLEEQFVRMGCEPTNPTGKTLLIDKILGVVRALGEKTFADNQSAARELAKNVVLALERSAVSIDVADRSVH